MSNESWQVILLIVFGLLLGVLLGSFGAILLLPVPVGEGWGSSLGALIGVVGAFLGARASFVWQEKARRRDTLWPFVDRLEHAYQLLVEAKDLTEILAGPLRAIGEQAIKVDQARPSLDSGLRRAGLLPVGGEQDEKIKQSDADIIRAKKQRFEDACRDLEGLLNAIDKSNLSKIYECVTKSNILLSWPLKNMDFILEQAQTFSLKSILEDIVQAQGCADFARNTFENSEGALRSKVLRGDIAYKAFVETIPALDNHLTNAVAEVKRLRSLS